jgi:hypothetical protein
MHPTQTWIRRTSSDAANVFRATLLAMIVAGCTAPKKEPEFNIAGYPPAFRAGFLDGCNSAHHPSSPTKDTARAKAEPQYAQGWRDGMDMCTKKKKP